MAVASFAADVVLAGEQVVTVCEPVVAVCVVAEREGSGSIMIVPSEAVVQLLTSNGAKLWSDIGSCFTFGTYGHWSEKKLDCSHRIKSKVNSFVQVSPWTSLLDAVSCELDDNESDASAPIALRSVVCVGSTGDDVTGAVGSTSDDVTGAVGSTSDDVTGAVESDDWGVCG